MLIIFFKMIILLKLLRQRRLLLYQYLIQRMRFQLRGEKNRFYNKNWEKKYNWLYEDETKGGAFCKLCENFMKNDASILKKTGGVFITVPFISYKKALGKDGKLEKHMHSSAHTTSTKMEKLRVNALLRPVHSQILHQSEEQTDVNRKSVSLLFRGVYFLAKQEIAHTTKYEPLINSLLIKCNKDLENWKNEQSERSTYCSKNTASELVACAGEVLTSRIEKKLLNKRFSILADESTCINNETKLSICLRYVQNNVPVETYLALVKIPNGLAKTIANAIDAELKKRHLHYKNLIAFGFDGASNFSGNTAGVRKKLSEKAGRDVPYIHCRAHVLSLAAATCRNKDPKVKRVFYILKDIYKLFSKSPKRENILHEIQAVINDPILKVPECIEIRWLSHHRIVNAVKRSYCAIMIACEHLHKEGSDLASLAGGILLEMRNKSFFIILNIMDEALSAISNLSLQLQKENVSLTSVISMVDSTKEHLKSIANACGDEDSHIQKNMFTIMKKPSELCKDLTEDENTNKTFKNLQKYILAIIDEISNRFNDKAINLIKGASYFEKFERFLTISEDDVTKLCQYFEGIDANSVMADIKSFKFFVNSMMKNKSQGYGSKDSPILKLLQANIGYNSLISLCEAILCIPVSTASVERSFSTMNRILTKLRLRLNNENLQHCMLISVEGEEEPSEEFIEEVINVYGSKKSRRICLL